MTQKIFFITISTAVQAPNIPQGLGCNARLSLSFEAFMGLDNEWIVLKKQILQKVDHHHLGALQVFSDGEQSYWQILSVVEDCLKTSDKLFSHWIFTCVEIAGQQRFCKRRISTTLEGLHPTYAG